MPPDLQKYLPYVEAFDLTEAQKAELIHSVWYLMEGFVDRAFGEDSTQRCVAAQASLDSNAPGDTLESRPHSLSINFKEAE